MEEAGELSEAIGKFRNLSGEKEKKDSEWVMRLISQELLDVAQTAVTMMFVLEEQFGIDIDEALQNHCNKLIDKGYLKI